MPTSRAGVETAIKNAVPEVTEIVEREQRISVLNRVLRHNLRNELNIIDGYIEALASDDLLPDQRRICEDIARLAVDQAVDLVLIAGDVFDRSVPPAEAVSWGKVDPDKLPDAVVCYTDSTIAAPLLGASSAAGV